MQPNPFAPPRTASVAPGRRVAAMRKPASVWLLQALSLLVGGVCACGLVGIASTARELGVDADLLARGAFFGLLLLCAVLAIVGSQQRRGFGRWSGLLLMLAVAAIAALFCGLVLAFGQGDPKGFHVITADRPTLLAAMALAGIALGLGAAFGFSVRCRAWFGASAAARPA